ncbi:hypothetical protein [Streptomyces sp. NPDC006784]|uniref:hypothetical protein n=1 Tax=Streptomyces sp. NPDC006784 TaxID=3364764 RepID=UPI0036CC90FC
MAATGGSGRSTVSFLLAHGLAAAGSTVVLDTAARLASPWPIWTKNQRAEGLVALPPDRPLSASYVRSCAADMPGPEQADWQVLTDGREWHASPLSLPADPAAWYQLAAMGGWQAVLADTAHSVPHDILSSRYEGSRGQTRGWYDLPYSVPVLCAAATADGVQALQRTAMTLHAEGMPLQRSVAVLVATADGRPPGAVRAAVTMLTSQAGAVLTVQHDPQIRAHGLRNPAKLSQRGQQMAVLLAGAVLSVAGKTWGDPLPTARRPAAFPLAVPQGGIRP